MIPWSTSANWPSIGRAWRCCRSRREDRKSTRLNSSHITISYAVFCLKKKKAASATATALRCSPTFPSDPLYSFLNVAAPPQVYTLSLHDALPISMRFFLTRLADWESTPAGALVKPHDPMEYERKLAVHRAGVALLPEPS